MSLITSEQFDELSEDYPELAQCYHIHNHIHKDAAEDSIDYTSGD